MIRPLLIPVIACLGLSAAELPAESSAVPTSKPAADAPLTASERLVIKLLRSQVFPAEIQILSGGYQDADGNGRGEYMFVAQLAGRAATSHFPLRGGETSIHMLTGPLATGLVACGYRFTAVLPGGKAGLVVESEPPLPFTEDGAADRERHFAVIAAPTDAKYGTHAFLISETGQIHQVAARPGAPDPHSAISYVPSHGDPSHGDSEHGTWAVLWPVVPVVTVNQAMTEKEPTLPTNF